MTKKRHGAKVGRPIKHGGYSIINRDRAIKDNPEIRRYLEACREGLVRDVGGTEDGLSEPQRIMIDRIVSRLAVCRLIECYVERLGIFRRDRLEGGKVLELEPALGVNYLAFSNSIDRALQALGLGKREEGALDLGKYIEQKDQEEAKAKAKGRGKAGTKAQDGRVDRQGKGGKGKAMGQDGSGGDDGNDPGGSSEGI